MNKQQIEHLIDRLADKTLSFGCIVQKRDGSLARVIDQRHSWWLGGAGYGLSDASGEAKGHPIYLHRVIALIYERAEWLQHKIGHVDETITQLISTWSGNGLERSLQEIVQESTWGHELCDACLDPDPCECHPKNTLKSPEARALCDYLLSTFPDYAERD